MRPPNYQQNRKQKEQSRKLRQAEKQQRRTARVRPEGEAGDPTAADAGDNAPTVPAGGDQPSKG